MTKESTHQYLLDTIHPSQLEEKYGGEAPDATQFWPPLHISDEYGYDPDWIVDHSIEESNEAPDIEHGVVNKGMTMINSSNANDQIKAEDVVVEEVDLPDTQAVSTQKQTETPQKKKQENSKKSCWCCTIF